jgi:hypothetical protein
VRVKRQLSSRGLWIMRVALSVARPKTALPELSRNHRSELQHPAPDSFVGDVEPTLREQILHVALAQRKVQVEPHSVLDDNWRKAVTAV